MSAWVTNLEQGTEQLLNLSNHLECSTCQAARMVPLLRSDSMPMWEYCRHGLPLGAC